jgi:hypothetical protein
VAEQRQASDDTQRAQHALDAEPTGHTGARNLANFTSAQEPFPAQLKRRVLVAARPTGPSRVLAFHPLAH